jgi:hypothetical protein
MEEHVTNDFLRAFVRTQDSACHGVQPPSQRSVQQGQRKAVARRNPADEQLKVNRMHCFQDTPTRGYHSLREWLDASLPSMRGCA